MSLPQPGQFQFIKRRSRRHIRNRRIRRCFMAGAIVLCVAFASGLALQYLSPSLFHARSTPPSFQEAELSRRRLLDLNETISQAAAPSPNRPVYPYSLVPGGVEDAKELKWVAEHDPIVGAHYAGFDYEHARVVRLTLARTVFMSFRIGNHVYWTRHRLTLRKGEKVITDGRITARARCGNRVEEVPQQAGAPNEPPAVVFDQPIRMPAGTAMQAPPVPFQSAFMNRPSELGPLSLYEPVAGGNLISLSPPPLPAGLCAPGRKKGDENGCCVGSEGGGGKKNKKGGCGGAGGVVPEPSTWLLMASGLAAIYWQARHKLARV